MKATIVNSYVGETEGKGTLFVGHRLKLEDGQEMHAKTYITEKSYGIARVALKKCGFDPDTQELGEIQQQPELLSGKEIEVSVYDDPPYGMKCEIVIDRPKVVEDKLTKATQGLRNVKKKQIESDGEIPF